MGEGYEHLATWGAIFAYLREKHDVQEKISWLLLFLAMRFCFTMISCYNSTVTLVVFIADHAMTTWRALAARREDSAGKNEKTD